MGDRLGRPLGRALLLDQWETTTARVATVARALESEETRIVVPTPALFVNTGHGRRGAHQVVRVMATPLKPDGPPHHGAT